LIIMDIQPTTPVSAPVHSISDVVYARHGGHPLLLDILRPEPVPPEPMPIIIWIHGGGWSYGDKRDTPHRFLAEHGFFCVSLNHRPSSERIFPAQIHDVKAAVRWLRAHAEEYRVDAAHIGVWGHSSGGHLAALLGTSAGVPELESATEHEHRDGSSSGVQAVVAVSAPSDFLQLGSPFEQPDLPIARFVGGPLREREATVRTANPITHIRDSVPPFLIVHGERDEAVPIRQAELLHEALKRTGAEVTFVRVEDAGHYLAARPDPQRKQGAASMHDQTVGMLTADLERTILAFFDRHLRPSSCVVRQAAER